MVPLRDICLHEIFSFQFIYLPIKKNKRETKGKKKHKILLFRLSWRGSPKEASGLIDNGLPRINN